MKDLTMPVISCIITWAITTVLLKKRHQAEIDKIEKELNDLRIKHSGLISGINRTMQPPQEEK